MNQLRKQRWLIVAMLFFVLISGIGTDVIRISQMDTSDHFHTFFHPDRFAGRLQHGAVRHTGTAAEA